MLKLDIMVDLGQKLLNNINSALMGDNLIDEYDFLPVMQPTANTNPIICIQHKLGIEAWAVKVVFTYCYERLLSWRGNKDRLQPTDVINVKGWSQVVLMVTADCMTAWNIRKNLIQEGHISTSEELRFTELVLTKHPKSCETFFQRKWLLSNLLVLRSNTDSTHVDNISLHMNEEDAHISKCLCNRSKSRICGIPSENNPGGLATDLTSSPEVEMLILKELKMCQCASERYANNYHAWTHRIWALQQHCNIKLAEQELHQTEEFVNKHISDHSAYHYRQVLLVYVGSYNTTKKELLHSELLLCTDWLERYPGHEALWYHRRAIIQRLCHSPSTCINSVVKRRRTDGSYAQGVLQHEQVYCRDLTNYYDKKSLSRDDEWQMTLLNRHSVFITRILNAADSTFNT